MAAPDVARLLARLARALDGLGVPWFVFGAQAVIAAGAVRVTGDIDVTTDDLPSDRLLSALRREGFVLRPDIDGLEELIEHHRILPLADRRSGYRVAVVRAGPGPDQAMLHRAIKRRVGRRQIPFIETNDLLALKVLAGREKDLEDVRTLLRSGSPEIDPAVVRHRLSELSAILDDPTLVPLFEQQLERARPRRH